MPKSGACGPAAQAGWKEVNPSLHHGGAVNSSRPTFWKGRIAALEREQTSADEVSHDSTEGLRKGLIERLAQVAVPVPDDLAGTTNLQMRFRREKAGVCGILDRQATNEAVDIKTKLESIDFRDQPTDPLEDYQDHWAALESFRRLINGIISAGFSEIRTVAFLLPERVPVTGEPAWEIVRYGIKAEVTGSYENYVALYNLVNKPQKFVLVSVSGVRSKTGDTGGELLGTITAHGLRLAARREKERRTKGTSEPPRFKR